jgi:hypothetical protein
MAEATMPTWRAALTNRDHDLYAVAWTLFSRTFSPDLVDERAGEQKDAAIDLILEVIQDEDLQDQTSLGNGRAPVNAVYMIQKWEVKEHISALLAILEQTTSSQTIYRPTIDAIVSFDADAIDPVLEWVEVEEEMRPEAAEILSRLEVEDDERPYNMILSWMEPDEFNLIEFAEYLIDLNPERAVTDLRTLAANSEFEKEERSTFRDLAKGARKIAKQRQKEAKAAEADSDNE